MDKSKQPLQHTLQLIIDILSFETPSQDLKEQLSSDGMDWDAIVIIASKHFVLPAVYCRLEQKSLLTYLPQDLNNYLNELAELNRVRNVTLLEEVQQISRLFNTQHIDHVFIKGTALLAGNYFKDYGERMIGDIDILVASDDLDKAFNLLVEEGYSQFVKFNYQVKNYRHQPRQISKERLGAVELHDHLLKHGNNHLIPKDHFLSTKQIVNGIAIPNSEHLIWNGVLAQQINDKAYYFGTLNLKSLYDVLVLCLGEKKEIVKALSSKKYSSRFLTLSSVFVSSLRPDKISRTIRFDTWFYQMTLKHPKIRFIIYRTKLFYATIQERLQLIFFNQSYRRHVLKNKILK